jgi:hypothetical protein
MSYLITFALVLSNFFASAQKDVTIRFENDYDDVYHLALLIYTPDGKNQTKLSNIQRKEGKTYTLPVNTEIYVADAKQEVFTMKGNDIKATGLKPMFVLSEKMASTIIALSSITSIGKTPTCN